MRYALGKTAARPGAVKMKFGAYFSAPDLPTPPLVFGRPWLVPQPGMLANDSASDCVQAGGAHETMLWTAESTGTPASFTDANVLADYLAMNPGDTAYADGTDMQAAAAYRQKTGLIDIVGKRHTIDAYVALKPGDLEQIAVAAYLLGAVGIGVQLPMTAMDQFNAGEPWSYVAAGSATEGGHYVPLIGRNSAGNFLIWTWGRLQAVTPGWLAQYMDEGIAYLSLDRLRDGVSPQGFDEAALLKDQAALQSV
jgi:hypothetical protein